MRRDAGDATASDRDDDIALDAALAVEQRAGPDREWGGWARRSLRDYRRPSDEKSDDECEAHPSNVRCGLLSRHH
jgi:hypothetical protein